MASAYQTHTAPESFSEGKRQKVLNHILRSDTVIVIVMHRDAQERVPEWEEVAAVAAAVQNMWLTATAMGLGAYWSTPAHMCQLDTFLKLSPGQRCLGLFYIGHYDMPQMEGSRQTLDEKVVWYTD
jgi:nitroreductase